MRMQQLSQISQLSMRAVVACVFASAALTACASASGGGSPGRQFADTRANSRTLTAGDFERVPDAATALDAVRRLRPLFLRPRAGSFTARGQQPVIAVYVNDMYAGNADVLQLITPGSIEAMRYLQRSEAMTFAGSLTRGDGFIMVTLKGFNANRATGGTK